jgi:long-chain acyl-CoA synthetase
MHIRDHATTDPHRPAVVLYPSDTVVTFGELEARANQLAHLFRSHGLVAGDAVAVLMENNKHLHVIMWAARRCGLYYVPVNTHLTAGEAAYIVANSNARAVIGSARQRATLASLHDHLPEGLPALLMVADDELDGWQRYPDCVAHLPATPVAHETEGDLLQYSSGTTGRPKGIKRALAGSAPAAAPNPLLPLFTAMGLGTGAVYLSPAPLYHTAPAVWSMCAQAQGLTTVVLEKFEPQACLHAIERHRITHGHFVPAMFVRMLKLPSAIRDSYDLSSLQRIIHAAAPCPIAIKSAMIDWWGPIVDEFYSSSEGAGITFITATEWLTHPGSVGRALLGTIHVVDADGTELPPGQDGDIYFEGGYDFEYLGERAKTDAAHNAFGWSTVGDVGHLDEEGYLYLTDRRNHMIISGGVNIYPQEAENLLISHPKVLDAAVFGIPDEDMGQSVHAAVQTTDPVNATDAFAAELLGWIRGRLAHYKCPRTISFEAELPRTETGKLFKHQLVERYSK